MILISHAHEDRAAYTLLCQALDRADVARWDQEQMLVGRGLAEQLRQAIAACDACVFIATRRSLASQWCMAELGAFWGAGKDVLIFQADVDLDVRDMPPQFEGLLRSDDAGVMIGQLQRLSARVPLDVLTPDLVLLLRYLARDEHWVLPDHYGRALAAGSGVTDELSERELRGWQRAVRYALLYLAHLGLAEKQSDTAVTYLISDAGKRLLGLAEVQRRFSSAFEKELRQ